MATKPNSNYIAPPASPMFVVTFNDFGWGAKLLVPQSMMTRFAEMMSMCTHVEEEWIDNNVIAIKERGDPDYGAAVVSRKHVVLSAAEADEFISYYKATAELIPAEDKPPSGTPVVTLAEFREAMAAKAAEGKKGGAS